MTITDDRMSSETRRPNQLFQKQQFSKFLFNLVVDQTHLEHSQKCRLQYCLDMHENRKSASANENFSVPVVNVAVSMHCLRYSVPLLRRI
jgi:hypothetical protein